LGGSRRRTPRSKLMVGHRRAHGLDNEPAPGVSHLEHPGGISNSPLRALSGCGVADQAADEPFYPLRNRSGTCFKSPPVRASSILFRVPLALAAAALLVAVPSLARAQSPPQPALHPRLAQGVSPRRLPGRV